MNCGAVMEEQALGKSRLIVKSHSPVRSRVNWAIALLMMSSAIWLSFEYGRMQGGFFVLEAVETESDLRQQIAGLTTTSDGLRQQVAVLETSSRIDEEAYSQVEERLVELQQKLAERQKDLNFYRGIMAPESQAEGLQIKEMNLLQLAEAKYFRLHLVLMQAINHSRIVSGRVRISVDGVHDGKSVTRRLCRVSRATSGIVGGPASMMILATKDRVEIPSRSRSSVRAGRLERWRVCALVMLALLTVPGVLQAQTMSWQDAVAELAGERTRAETCVRLLKRHGGGDEAALSRGETAYAQAKAEMDAVIAGLVVALAQDDPPESLSDLKARLTRGVEAREAFCTGVMALVPDSSEGTRNVIVELFGAVLGPLIEGLVELWKYEGDKDELRRITIQTQLEATRWSGFADIEA